MIIEHGGVTDLNDWGGPFLISNNEQERVKLTNPMPI